MPLLQVFFGDPTKKKLNNKEILYILGDVFGNKWTTKNGGVNTYNGWTREATTRFEELRRLNKEAREKEGTKAIEEACLEMLRKQKGRTASSIREERASKRRKVRASMEEEEEEEESDLEDMFD